jgi:hypothetical protein
MLQLLRSVPDDDICGNHENGSDIVAIDSINHDLSVNFALS